MASSATSFYKPTTPTTASRFQWPPEGYFAHYAKQQQQQQQQQTMYAGNHPGGHNVPDKTTTSSDYDSDFEYEDTNTTKHHQQQQPQQQPPKKLRLSPKARQPSNLKVATGKLNTLAGAGGPLSPVVINSPVRFTQIPEGDAQPVSPLATAPAFPTSTKAQQQHILQQIQHLQKLLGEQEQAHQLAAQRAQATAQAAAPAKAIPQPPPPSPSPSAPFIERQRIQNIKTFSGKYIRTMYGESIKQLGAGTGGAVCLHNAIFIDWSTGAKQQKPVAVKTFTFPESINFERQLDVINREASITLNLNHPNIIKTYEYVLEWDETGRAGTFYCVMEYCEFDLFDLVNGKLLYPALIESIFHQTVLGVHYLHKTCRMVHRDLKLDNICITREGHVKIVDFGAARIMGSAPTTTGPCGSDPYLTPEVMANNRIPYDPYSLDVWALAIVYISLVSGHFPWEKARSSDANFRAYLSVGPSIFEHWLPPYKGHVLDSSLIKRMLDLEPTKRPTIEQVYADPFMENIRNTTLNKRAATSRKQA
ncbi:kinase-like protein [Ramicandelaber brevisporus]|nr:kinase-like protein [Ramicandelaber brevisporus]